MQQSLALCSVILIVGCSNDMRPAAESSTPKEIRNDTDNRTVQTTPPSGLEHTNSTEQDTEIAKKYYTVANQQLLSSLQKYKEWYHRPEVSAETKVKIIELMRNMIRDGPSRLIFGEDFALQPKVAAYVDDMKVIQIIDASTALVSIGPVTAMAVGWDTTELVDDVTVTPKDAIIVSGTTEYVAVTGAKKRIYVVKPFDLAKFATDHAPKIPMEILDFVNEAAN